MSTFKSITTISTKNTLYVKTSIHKHDRIFHKMNGIQIVIHFWLLCYL